MEWVPITFLIFKGTVLFTGMFFAIKWHYDQDRKKKNDGGGSQWTTEMRLFAAMIVALTLSLIGIVYAGCWGNVADGGRGGALGCAFTFFMIFMSKPHEQDEVPAEPAPATLGESLEQLERLKRQAEQLRATLAARLDSVEREKIYLGVAAIMSALAWKFGDSAAAWLDFLH
jgi:hypothetical protein